MSYPSPTLAPMAQDRQLTIEGIPVVCTADWGEAVDRYRRDEAMWDQLGETSQDPGWTEPA